jgi:PAS domain S-box-containing protein
MNTRQRLAKVRVAFLLVLGSLLSGQGSQAQNHSVDSLRHLLKNTAEKEVRFAILTELTFRYRQSKPDSALHFGLGAIELGKQLGYRGKLAATYNFMGLAHLYKGELSRAFDNYQSALGLAEAAQDDSQIGHSHNNLGRLFLAMGDIEQSHDQFLLAQTAFEKSTDRPGLSYLYLSFADWYEQNKNYDSAISFAAKALALRRQLPSKSMLISAIIDMGQLHQRKKEYRQAARYFAEAEALAYKYNDSLPLAELKIMDIELLVAQDSVAQVDEKIHYASQLVKPYQIDLRAKLYLQQGKMALKKNDPSKAIYFLKQIVEDASVTYYEVKNEASSLLVESFYTQGNFKEAEKYRLKSKLEQGNRKNQNLIDELEKINLKLELERRNKANQELELANTRKKTSLLTIGIVVSVGLAIALILAFRRKRNQDQEQHLTQERILLQKLTDSERKNKKLVEESLLFICTHDLEGRFLTVNTPGARTIGYEPSELIGKSIESIMQLGHSEEFKKYLDEIKSTGTFSGFMRIQTRWEEARVFLYKNVLVEDDDQPAYVMGSAQDVTDWKNTEREEKRLRVQLAESEKMYRLVSENSQDIIALFDSNGTHLYTSPSTEAILGYTQEEWAAMPPFTAIHPNDVKNQRLQTKGPLERGESVQGIQFRLRKKDGTYLWMDGSYTPLLDENKKTYAVQSILRDITQRKLAEDKLADSERLYRLLSENSNDLICLHQPDSTYQFVSSSVMPLLGYTPDELIGTNPYQIIHPDDHDFLRHNPHQQTLEGESIKNIMYRIRKKNGDYIWMETYTQPIEEDGEVIGFQTSSRDVTQRREYEEALSEAKNKAEEATRYKSDFLSSMSHEIRTPLNAIIGLADILLKRNPREEQIKIFQMLKNSGDNLLSIVNDILDFSKVEAGRMELETALFNLPETGKEVVQLFQERATSKKIELLFKVGRGMPTMIKGDQGKIRQVISNLVSNSIKFTAQGKVELALQLINKENNRYTILFEVSDTGIGIASDQLDLIFESFAQASQDTARKYGGTGLGLAIVKRLVNLMSSEIFVESEVGKGSRFFFTLLVEEAAREGALKA